MTWFYQAKAVTELPEGTVGFVYCITNRTNNRKYIGKKLALFSRTKIKTVTLKSGIKKKKKVKSKVDSDWLNYYGSCDALNKDIELLGTASFSREILYFCKSKAECSYIEAREQFSRRVLESDAYYNGHISVRVHHSHILPLGLIDTNK